MRCLLVSFFDSNNLGDILIGECLWELASKNFRVDRFSYSEKQSVNRVSNDISEYKNLIPHSLMYSTKVFLKKFALFRHIKFYLYKYRKVNIDSLDTKMKNCDFLLIGGGNMIFDLDKFSLSAKKFDYIVSLAKRNNKKVFAISLGIGPFKTYQQEIAAVRALSKCDYITFRDDASYNIFRKHNVKHKNVYVSIDPVFLLPKINEEEREKNIIALNVINSKLLNESQESYDNIIRQYAKLAETLANKFNKKVILFSTEEADYSAVEDVYSKIQSNKLIEILRVSNINKLLDLYNDTLILIGTRMHSMIVAYSQHVPVIGLSWQSKVESMFEIIDSKEDLYKYTEIELRLNDIVECVNTKISNLTDEKKKIQNNINKIRTRNEINEKILEELHKSIMD